MRRPFLFALTALTALAVAASPLSAQGRACAARGAKLPAAGAWAEYNTAEGTMRMLYLGKETAGERLELWTAGRRGAMVMQQEGQPPMKMSAQMLGMMRSRMPSGSQVSEASCGRMIEVGKERITVPAGTYQTTHYRDSTGGIDVWVAASIPFGAVKVVGRDHTAELTGSGTGATTKITGTPQEMPGMGGQPGGRRPN